MSATWTSVRADEYRGCGYWTCWGCNAEFTAEAFPPLWRFTHRDGMLLYPSRALCAHCAERPPAEGETDVIPRGRVIAWEP